jgi:hypothetical protein
MENFNTNLSNVSRKFDADPDGAERLEDLYRRAWEAGDPDAWIEFLELVDRRLGLPPMSDYMRRAHGAMVMP